MGLQISMVMAKAIIQNEEFYFSKKVNPGRIESVNVIKTHLRILKLSTNIKRTEETLFSLDIVFVHFIDLISLCINGKKKKTISGLVQSQRNQKGFLYSGSLFSLRSSVQENFRHRLLYRVLISINLKASTVFL